MIDVAFLGTGGTLPLPDRFLSAALARCGGQLVLIDCGEGTQVSLRKLGWGLKDVGTILLTHFHADHVAGLPGLLLTIGNSGRTREEPLTVAGPRGVQRVVESLRVIAPAPALPGPQVPGVGRRPGRSPGGRSPAGDDLSGRPRRPLPGLSAQPLAAPRPSGRSGLRPLGCRCTR